MTCTPPTIGGVTTTVVSSSPTAGLQCSIDRCNGFTETKRLPGHLLSDGLGAWHRSNGTRYRTVSERAFTALSRLVYSVGKMLDVSSVQHPNNAPINWHAVKEAGFDYVMIKATEGVGYTNPFLDQDMHGALGAGLGVGYYHFCHPNNSVLEEFTHFAATVEERPHQLGLAMDCEIMEGMSWDALKVWCVTFMSRLHTITDWPIMYSNENWLNNLIGAPWGNRLWYAHPTTRPRRQVWAWQQAPISVAGIPDTVDHSTLYELPKVG